MSQNERRIDVRTLRPPDAVVAMPDGKEYPVRGNLPVETVMELLELEAVISQPTDVRDRFEAIARVNAIVVALIKERTPDAPDSFDLGMEEVMGIVTFVLGADTVSAEVVSLLTDGASGPLTEEEALAQAASEGGGGDATPLRSRKRSSSTSSSSEKGTTGRRSIGKTSRGEHSERTPQARSAG